MIKRYIRLREHAPLSDRLLIPNADQIASSAALGCGPFRLRTNQDGYIRSGMMVESEKRTVVLGDSFVECSFQNENERICAMLESVDQATSDPILGVVHNAGYSGSTTLNLLNALLNKVLSSPPDRLIFVLPANDAFVHRFASTYWNTSEYYSPIFPAEVERANAELGGYSDLSGATLCRLIGLVIEASALFEIELMIATFPHAQSYDAWPQIAQKYPAQSWFEAVVNARRKLNGAVRTMCLERSIPFVDLELEIGDRSELFYDELHMNAKGCAFVAEKIYKKLQDG